MHKHIAGIVALLIGTVISSAWAQGARHADPSNNKNQEAASDEAFDRIMRSQNNAGAGTGGPQSMVHEWSSETRVEISLEEYTRVGREIERRVDEEQPEWGPVVALGAAEYSGRAIRGALKLELVLSVTLGRPGGWKVVPLVGDDTVLVKGTVMGKEIPVTCRDGYHVWVTRETGDVTIELQILVPARGPRGSLEYDFRVVRTPVTSFSCLFPGSGLTPRISTAVRSEVTAEEGGSRVQATLRSTTRIHVVGFKDMGSDGAAARSYAESLHLLSVDEGSLDLFTVVRYTILYAGTKRFDLLLPEGMSVVSADGMGAFRYQLEETNKGTVLRGETAFPMQNAYEISLRLRRQTEKAAETFDVPVPKCLGVEREHGWVAVEVPGKLRLEEEERSDVTAVDVRQLPREMLRSAVSPILKAYRYHGAGARVRLAATRLPEKEPESGSVDRIRAFSVVSTQGKVLTDMRIQLRNRLRPSLALYAADGAKVRSVHLDGEAVSAGLDSDGRLMLPLKRSKGSHRLEPITVRVVLESQISPLGLFGAAGLKLPALDLPVSSAKWTVYLPARNTYSGLKGEIQQQRFASEARWYHSPEARGPVRFAQSVESEEGVSFEAQSGGTGLLAVRIQLPESGMRLDYSRYWLENKVPLEVKFSFIRSWLLIPVGLLLAAVLGAGLVMMSLLMDTGFRRSPIVWAGVALVAGSIVPLGKLAGGFGIVGAVVFGVCVVVYRRGWLPRVLSAVATWAKGLAGGFRQRERATQPLKARQIVFKACTGIGMVTVGFMLGSALVVFALLLTNPL